MKYFYTLIVTGFLIPFLPLCAEVPELEETYSEASLISLDEEFALLDEEFKEFITTPTLVENQALVSEPTAALVQEEAISSELPFDLAENEALVSEPTAALVQEEAFLLEEFPSQESLTLGIESIPNEFETVFAPQIQEPPATLNIQETAFIGELEPINKAISVDLRLAFTGSPIIYSLLLGMSVIALSIWLYSVFALRSSAKIPLSLMRNVKNKLNSNCFDEALSLCQENNNLFCKMVLSGIQSRRHGLPVMIEAMKAEGKRTSIDFWQKIGLLNDIAVIAPMIGLLGTVLGMFYAFYDVNRSIESVSVLFDGLGISVGTTVAGLIVAILALILHSTAKYRLIRALTLVENEAQNVATLIDDRTSIYKG